MAAPRATYDVIVLGAGAAGLFCAAEAGKRSRRVLVLDHAQRLGEKIRISGGGRCNFTNLHARPENFLSQHPKFCISALRGFGRWSATPTRPGRCDHSPVLARTWSRPGSR